MIADCQDSKRPPIGERLMHKIHTPTLAGAGRHQRGAAMQGPVIAPWPPHPQLQSIQPVSRTGPASGSRAALTSQQHPSTWVPIARSNLGEISNAQPDGRTSFSRRARFVRQSRAADRPPQPGYQSRLAAWHTLCALRRVSPPFIDHSSRR